MRRHPTWKILFSSLLLLAGALNASAVGPSCSEEPMTIDKLNALAASKDVNSMQDFLEKIPKNAMQLFTFVTNSKSLHHGSGEGTVSPMWPRVLRATTDGKITISFVCDPRNPTYGKVEVLYFDETINKTRSIEYDFGPKEKPVVFSKRVNKDLVSCTSCHAGTPNQGNPSLKHVWPEYHFWGDCERDRGITLYGASDDFMSKERFRSRYASSSKKLPSGCNQEKDRAAHEREVDDYLRFREAQRNNPCFATLPWTQDSQDLSFPYINKLPEYSRRPNLILTEGYSNLTARRNLGVMKRSPDYPFMKYLLAYEGAKCNMEFNERMKLQKQLEQSLGYSFPTFSSFLESPPFLSGFANASGLHDRDWNLELMTENDPLYNTGSVSIGGRAGIQVLREVAAELPELKDVQLDTSYPVDSPYYVKEQSDFSCVDTVQIKYDDPQTCKILRKKMEESLELLLSLRSRPCQNRERSQVSPETEQLSQDVVSNVIGKLDQDSIARGKRLVQPEGKGKCILCHSVGNRSDLPGPLHFLASDQDSSQLRAQAKANLRERIDAGFLEKLNHRLVRTQSMPPFENSLTKGDREDIQAYIESLGN